MAQASKNDIYVNMMCRTMSMVVANTLTFSEIEVGLNIFDKVGLKIARLEYEPTMGVLAEMTTAGDYLILALTNSDNIPSLDPHLEQVIDRVMLGRVDFGTAGSAALQTTPLTHDFSTLPGGGLLIPPKPLFMAAYSVGLASPATVRFRVYFTIQRLADAEYLELLETRRAFG